MRPTLTVHTKGNIMAEETKKTTSTTKKTTTPKVEKPVDDTAKLMAQMAKQIADLQAQLKAVSGATPVVEARPADTFGLKKVKVVNLMHNPLNLSTQPYGNGRAYTFEKYGDVRLIKFDDLVDCVASYPNTFEKGLVYICDNNVVEALELSEEYERICTKEMLDEVIKLEDETAVELFVGCAKILQESMADEIAKNINNGVKYDRNYLARIAEESQIDIEQMAEDLASQKKKNDEE